MKKKLMLATLLATMGLSESQGAWPQMPQMPWQRKPAAPAGMPGAAPAAPSAGFVQAINGQQLRYKIEPNRQPMNINPALPLAEFLKQAGAHAQRNRTISMAAMAKCKTAFNSWFPNIKGFQSAVANCDPDTIMNYLLAVQKKLGVPETAIEKAVVAQFNNRVTATNAQIAQRNAAAKANAERAAQQIADNKAKHEAQLAALAAQQAAPQAGMMPGGGFDPSMGGGGFGGDMPPPADMGGFDPSMGGGFGGDMPPPADMGGFDPSMGGGFEAPPAF